MRVPDDCPRTQLVCLACDLRFQDEDADDDVGMRDDAPVIQPKRATVSSDNKGDRERGDREKAASKLSFNDDEDYSAFATRKALEYVGVTFIICANDYMTFWHL
jgi:hypothetical protein